MYYITPKGWIVMLPRWNSGKEYAPNAGDAREAGLIAGLGRSLGVGNGNPLQYSCLEKPMDRGIWQATVHGITKCNSRLSTHIHEGINC